MGLVSVILPCFNAGHYLSFAIESIINQTYSDIEIIAVDDCSTDDTLKTLQHYAKIDKRIKIVQNYENLGLIKTLNKAIQLANGEFIARMDQDDISLPKRFEKQLKELKVNQTLDLVSCRWIYIDDKGNEMQKSFPRTFTTQGNLFESFFGPPFGHPTVMMRAATLKKYLYRYSSHTRHIEDYDLWARMLMSGSETKVINEILFKYRSFADNTTHKHHETQSRNMVFCGVRNINDFLGIEINQEIQKTVFNRQEPTIDKEKLIEAVRKFKEIKEVFIDKVQPKKKDLRQVNNFALNHISDILIQYALKNKKPSYTVIARILFENFSLILSPRNIFYINQKIYTAMLHLL